MADLPDVELADLRRLTDAEKLELLESLTLKAQHLDETKMDRYEPYPKQVSFHEAGGDPSVFERLLMAGNQLGKCVSASTLIDHPDGSSTTAGELYARGTPFPVMAWDGSRAIEAMAITPIRKPAEPMVRVWLSSGLWFECALNHRVLSEDGYVFVGLMLPFLRVLPACGSEIDPLVRAEDALRWFETLQDSHRGCHLESRLCGGQPLLEVKADPDASLLQDGAPPCSCPLFCSDGLGCKCRRSPPPLTAPHSSLDAGRQIEAQCAESQGPCACTCAQLRLGCSQTLQPTLAESASGLRSCDEVFPCRSISLVNPNVACNHIIGYQSISSQSVYDFTVPQYWNYISRGVIHHNTYSAAMETAFHLTGLYPDDWKGAIFDAPVTGWAASETSQSTRDTVQRLLLGEVGAWGTGTIPKEHIVDIKRATHGVADAVETIMVRHKGGGLSRVTIKTYDQGRKRWQGETLDFVWLDEEPPAELYTEAITRTNATQGIVYMTFTPLMGMSGVVKRFLIEKAPGTHVTNMTIEDALHYTPEQRAAIIAKYPEHERQARANGVPMRGSGLIFPVAEEKIKVTGFAIPHYWPRICGIDFGIDHPFGAAWLAIDPDSDVIYVTDCYREKGAFPIIHAAAIRPRGDWIPVAWPHDGLQHDKGTGDELAGLYRAQKLNLTKSRATHPPKDGDKEGEGGNSVEAGLLDMLERMQTGRFKVFNHLADWFEEYRMYHRKDGKVVKKDDDLISATRYAVMMKRHAKVNAPKKQYNQGQPPRGVLDAVAGY